MVGKGSAEELGMKMDESKPGEGKTYSLEIRGWYRVVRGIVGFLLRVLSRLEIQGLEDVPAEGPYLLITNHLHWLDPPVLGVAFPHRAHIFAAEKWENHWLLGPFLRSMDAIFVNRGEVDRKALRQALAILEGGGVLGLAPEGTRSKTGAMQRGRSGAAYMAYRTGARLVPVVVTGQQNVFSSLRRLRRAKVQVVFGPPFAPPPVEGKASAAQVHDFAEAIMYHLAAMLPPEYRGVYDDVAEKRPDLLALYATDNQQQILSRS
jgi:1-acyl-sn-glycerol-3-phosphate acyltransferase